MKRPFRPIFLAALCWILVALVPPTRNGLLRARDASHPPAEPTYEQARARFEREARRRFPDDRRVQLYALAQAANPIGSVSTPTMRRKVEIAARKLGEDPTVLALLLTSRIEALKWDRNEGPLTNPNRSGAIPKKRPGGQSPRAEWDAFLALARRGQKLEPDNTYFSWMALYALLATRRDDHARAELQRAARQSGYDDHSRDIALNCIAVRRLVNGAPLSVPDSFEALNTNSFRQFGKMRQTVRWVMETAIADRAAGNHARALDSAFQIAQMGRIMRRNSYSLIGALVASSIETTALNRLLSPASVRARRLKTFVPPRLKPGQIPVPDSNFLSLYAQGKGRADIASFARREAKEIAKWRGLSNSISFDYAWTGNTTAQIVAITAAERLRALILRAMPSILLLGALFTLLARRFRDDSGTPLCGFWRGAIAGAVLLIVASGFDALIAVGHADLDFGLEGWYAYLDAKGLLWSAPSWVSVGMAGVTIMLALHGATQWQQQQPAIKLKTRLKTAFDAPEDGLMRFDFGWMFGLIARGTLWTLLIGGLGWLGFNLELAPQQFGFEPATFGAILMAVPLVTSLVLHASAWRHHPRRRMALRLGLRLISGALLGFFVASSVIYALVSFGTLPMALRYDRNFQNAMQRGEVQIARAKLGI